MGAIPHSAYIASAKNVSSRLDDKQVIALGVYLISAGPRAQYLRWQIAFLNILLYTRYLHQFVRSRTLPQYMLYMHHLTQLKRPCCAGVRPGLLHQLSDFGCVRLMTSLPVVAEDVKQPYQHDRRAYGSAASSMGQPQHRSPHQLPTNVIGFRVAQPLGTGFGRLPCV